MEQPPTIGREDSEIASSARLLGHPDLTDVLCWYLPLETLVSMRLVNSGAGDAIVRFVESIVIEWLLRGNGYILDLQPGSRSTEWIGAVKLMQPLYQVFKHWQLHEEDQFQTRVVSVLYPSDNNSSPRARTEASEVWTNLGNALKSYEFEVKNNLPVGLFPLGRGGPSYCKKHLYMKALDYFDLSRAWYNVAFYVAHAPTLIEGEGEDVTEHEDYFPSERRLMSRFDCELKALQLDDHDAMNWCVMGDRMIEMVTQGDERGQSITVGGRSYTGLEAIARGTELGITQPKLWNYMYYHMQPHTRTPPINDKCYSEKECLEKMLELAPRRTSFWRTASRFLLWEARHEDVTPTMKVLGQSLTVKQALATEIFLLKKEDEDSSSDEEGKKITTIAKSVKRFIENTDEGEIVEGLFGARLKHDGEDVEYL